MKPKVFISYTTRGETDADRERNVARAAELYRLLEKGGKVLPLRDKERLELEIGEPWRPVLHEMLARAHGGVLLISPEALGSPWVAQEAAILEHRKLRTDWFALVPALVGGAQAGDLAGSALAAVEIGDRQSLVGSDDEVLAQIVAEVEKSFEDWQPRDAEAQVRDKVFTMLRGIDHSVLSLCAQQIGLDLDGFLADEKLSELMARAIAERMIEILAGGEIQPVLTGLQALIPALERKRAVDVFDTVRPFCVDAGVATKLRDAVLGTPGRPVVGVNAGNPATGTLCAERASIPLSNWTVNTTLDRYGEAAVEDEAEPSVVDDGGEPADVVAEVETVLCRELNAKPATLAAKITGLVKLKQPQLMVIPGEVDDRQLETLAKRYRALRLLVLTETRKPGTTEWPWQDVAFLDPGLADGVEEGDGAFALHELAREALAGFGND